MELSIKTRKAYSKLESNQQPDELTFVILNGRLLEFVLMRVNNGDYTERGLARLLGVSQPQIHNVLKGNRKLTPALADRIMQQFGLNIADLLHEHEIKNSLQGRQGWRPDRVLIDQKDLSKESAYERQDRSRLDRHSVT